jgi:transglutaminase-like putative cysteine protease
MLRSVCRLFGIFVGALVPVVAVQAQNTPPVRNVHISYTVEIPEVPAGAKTVDLWIPMPSSNDRQTVKWLNESELDGGRVTTDKKFGNRMYYRQFKPPFRVASDDTDSDAPPIKVELLYDVEVHEATVPEAKKLVSTKQGRPGRELAPYLGDLSMIPIKGRISQLAGDIKMPKGEPLRAGRAIYDYLVDTMVYNYKAPGAGVGDAVLACDSKTGDCTDYHSVFIGVCRWRGIPADHVFGLPIPPEKPEGDIRYAHCWARFWVDGVGWIPIDASRADKFPEDREYYFGTLGTTWVTLSHGRDVVLEPPQQGKPENMFHAPLAEVDGKPFHGIKWIGHYKDHAQTAAK